MPDLDPTAPVRSLRTLAGLTQTELAERMGTSQRRISLWESKGVAVRWELVGRVAEACGVDVRILGLPSRSTE